MDHSFHYPTDKQAPLPTSIGRFQIVKRAPGKVGSQASVYRALDPVSGREVALKVLGNSFDSYAQSLFAALLGEQDMEDLRREAQMLSSLHHLNIVELVETGEDPVCGPYVVMEWVTGGDLRFLLDSTPERTLSVSDALRIILGVLEGLAAAHDVGVVHLDIKPGNVLLDEWGRAKVADFGIAGRVSAPDMLSGRGTLGYMAPEQQDPGQIEFVGPATDIYGVGVLLFEMLTGRLPLQGDDILQLSPELPTTLSNVITRALDPDLLKRFSSARDTISALKELDT